VKDDRLKYEMNTFIFNDNGKPEAASGKHDDMIFATALALIGMDQIDQVEQIRQAERPHNVRAMLQFELSTGKVYSGVQAELFPEDEPQDCSPLTMLS
jgi:hypothetical protein